MEWVIFQKTGRHGQGCSAFSLVEMTVVMAVLVALMAAGAGIMGGTGAPSIKTGTELTIGMIDQARTAAITSRAYVVLAVAEPGDLPGGDERCRLGLIKVRDWPDSPDGAVDGALMRRWQSLPAGVVMADGDVDGAQNPLSSGELTIKCAGPKPLALRVHAIVFNPRGGLRMPEGSASVVMRVAEGHYRDGTRVPHRGGADGQLRENRLKIGRVTGRPYRTDG